ncbi:unnamed protein product [Urochloa humidicola]
MASIATFSAFFLLLSSFAAGANVATFAITNNCSFTVWPAALPVSGGSPQLDPSQTWTLNVPAGTSSGRIWGRTGCSFSGSSGHCTTGDCAGALSCSVSGQPPETLAEFSMSAAPRRPRFLRHRGDRRLQRGHGLLLQRRRWAGVQGAHVPRRVPKQS